MPWVQFSALKNKKDKSTWWYYFRNGFLNCAQLLREKLFFLYDSV
jgi:hypothetical protein